jgi:cytochrome c peroxidase
MKKSIFLIGILPAFMSLAFFTSCNYSDNFDTHETLIDDELNRTLKSMESALGESRFILPESFDYASIPQDPKNPLNEAKVALGMFLFHETGLGMEPINQSLGYETYSCASCHHVKAGFQANLRQGIGEGGRGFGFAGESRALDPGYPMELVDCQPIRTPSSLNVAYQKVSLWNGQFGAVGLNKGTEALWTPGTPKETNFLGYHGPETQAIAGMKVHRVNISHDFCSHYQQYEDLFMAAFPGMDPEEVLTREYAGLAIAAYQRTLLPNQAPFQRWLRGDQDAMTANQKNGFHLFLTKGKCITCHDSPALAKNEFHALGMNDLEGPGIVPLPDAPVAALGRGGFTNNPEDNFKFKVPQLYNLKDSKHYGHGASFKSIYEVITYKNLAVKQNPKVEDYQLSEHFQPLDLTKQERLDIADFIENALYDPNLRRYVPESLPTGNCFPNNDFQSQIDLGCRFERNSTITLLKSDDIK